MSRFSAIGLTPPATIRDPFGVKAPVSRAGHPNAEGRPASLRLIADRVDIGPEGRGRVAGGVSPRKLAASRIEPRRGVGDDRSQVPFIVLNSMPV
jgi:hypothetical protein